MSSEEFSDMVKDKTALLNDRDDLQREVFRLRIALRNADAMARAVDKLVERGALDARSLVADARLDYGEPWKYEFSGDGK